MLVVPIEEAKPGMKLAMTVTHPEHPEQDLLRRNFVLEQAVLDKMKTLGITCIYVDYPGLEDLDKFLAPNLSPERQKVYSTIRTTMGEFEKSANPTVPYADYYSSTHAFVEMMLLNGRHPIYLDETSSRLGNDAVRHSTAVAHLAIALGIKLEAYLINQRDRLNAAQARDVVNLGVAGMLHDLGKTKLPEKVKKYNALAPPIDPDDQQAWESHPQLGYDAVRNDIKATAAAAVLHHHQHFDGSGFPARDLGSGATCAQDGERIHVYARILLAADLYDRLSVCDDGVTRRSNVSILHILRSSYGKWIDPEIMTMLPKVVPPFPPGSKVTLSDKRQAIVTQVHPEDPYRPTVRPLGEDGWTMTADPVSLHACPDLRIIEIAGVSIDEMVPDRAAPFTPPPRTNAA